MTTSEPPIDLNAYEKKLVRDIGGTMGFGRMMQLGQELWREHLIEKNYPAGGEFAIGPCVAFMVPCPHPVKDDNGHCDICCGSGQITKGVAKLFEATHPGIESAIGVLEPIADIDWLGKWRINQALDILRRHPVQSGIDSTLVEKLEALKDTLPDDCTFTEGYMEKAIAIVSEHIAPLNLAQPVVKETPETLTTGPGDAVPSVEKIAAAIKQAMKDGKDSQGHPCDHSMSFMESFFTRCAKAAIAAMGTSGFKATDSLKPESAVGNEAGPEAPASHFSDCGVYDESGCYVPGSACTCGGAVEDKTGTPIIIMQPDQGSEISLGFEGQELVESLLDELSPVYCNSIVYTGEIRIIIERTLLEASKHKPVTVSLESLKLGLRSKIGPSWEAYAKYVLDAVGVSYVD